MKYGKRLVAACLTAALFLSLLAGCQREESLSQSSDPIVVTVWHYYNGDQQHIFDQLIQEFNETRGEELGIVVESHSHGGVNELNEKVLDAVYEKVGAEEVPDVFASYADTAYEINSLGKAADISQYLTDEEQARYVTSYLDEGRFETDGGFKIFPVAKSTELLTLNKTEWDAFAAAVGVSETDLATWEGIVSLSQRYYDWTDGLTPDQPDDGKAFFGRDAFANYIIIGSYQLGVELFQVREGDVTLNIDAGIMRRLWDNYYVPYVNGWFNAVGKFRSDDIRTGDLVAGVGSTSGSTYFPGEVTAGDGSTYPIEGAVYPLPNFAGTEPMAVQQGAGMVVVKSTEAQERAAVEFLKWFTQPEQNMRFAIASGYLPVTYAANDSALVDQAEEANGQELPTVLKESLIVGMEMTGEYGLYTSKAFESGASARKVVENSMKEQAAADRAAVLELMAGGMSRTEAVAQYTTDENFDAWLKSFQEALETAAAG